MRTIKCSKCGYEHKLSDFEMLSITIIGYLPCQNCRNQFIDPKENQLEDGMSIEKDVEKSMKVADELVDGKKKRTKEDKFGYNRARPGFAQEKKELLEELSMKERYRDHLIIAYEASHGNLPEEDKEERKRVENKISRIKQRLDEITVN